MSQNLSRGRRHACFTDDTGQGEDAAFPCIHPVEGDFPPGFAQLVYPACTGEHECQVAAVAAFQTDMLAGGQGYLASTVQQGA